MIYRRIVERQLRRAFEALNRGDHAPVLAAFGSPVEHKWGKVVSLRIYCDTPVLASVLHDLQAQGVADAGLPPIDDLTAAAA
jgi:hypothetical protein